MLLNGGATQGPCKDPGVPFQNSVGLIWGIFHAESTEKMHGFYALGVSPSAVDPAMLGRSFFDGESSSIPVHAEYHGSLCRGSSED